MLIGMGWGFVFFIPAGILFFGEVSGRLCQSNDFGLSIDVEPVRTDLAAH